MNKIMLSGRLTQNPDVRYTQNGKAVVSFTVAINRRVNGQDTADFIPVVAWERLAEVCGDNLTKGRLVLVEGRLQIRTYETEGGERRKVAEVVAGSVEFLDGKPQESAVGSSADPVGAMGQDVGWTEDIPF